MPGTIVDIFEVILEDIPEGILKQWYPRIVIRRHSTPRALFPITPRDSPPGLEVTIIKKPMKAPKPRHTLSLDEARRIALAAQGFLPFERTFKRKHRRRLARLFETVGLLQIDSVNALERSHYLPFFSRSGPYARSLLDDAAYGNLADRRLFEYWGHEASLMPVELQPRFRWRMHRAREYRDIWRGIADYGRNNASEAQALLEEIRNRGALGISGFKGEGGGSSWRGPKSAKMGLEWLFWIGEVTTTTRRNFERIYDLPERVLPAEVLNTPAPPVEESQRHLLSIAAGALGVAAEADLRDYFRLTAADAKPRIAELTEGGELIPVNVEGWKTPAYLHRRAAEAPIPRVSPANPPAALLSPFDSLIWNRARTERLFNFHYRIEIYTPAEKRRFGYYVMPFLLGDTLTARADLKTDRAARTLAVRGAFAESGTDPKHTADALLESLGSLAVWLGTPAIRISDNGDLAPHLLSRTRTAEGIPVAPA